MVGFPTMDLPYHPMSSGGMILVQTSGPDHLLLVIQFCVSPGECPYKPTHPKHSTSVDKKIHIAMHPSTRRKTSNLTSCKGYLSSMKVTRASATPHRQDSTRPAQYCWVSLPLWDLSEAKVCVEIPKPSLQPKSFIKENSLLRR